MLSIVICHNFSSIFRTVKKSLICLNFWISGLMRIQLLINQLGLGTQLIETGLLN